MRKSIILVAGLFIACVLCAGIPAVSAAENAKVPAGTPVTLLTAVPQATPPVTPLAAAPASTPAAQAPAHPANTTAATVADQKNWWETLWPLNTLVKDQQNKTEVPQGTVNPAVTAPAAPQQGAADNQQDNHTKNNTRDTINRNATTDKKVTATPTPQAPENP
jgi:hypothetical protein